MGWYLIKLVFRIMTGCGDHQGQFDEQYRLVRAASPDEARQKGRAIGFEEETCFKNQKGEEVRWSFVEVAQTSFLGQLHDGIEVFSQIREVDDAESYLDLVQHLSAARQVELF